MASGAPLHHVVWGPLDVSSDAGSSGNNSSDDVGAEGRKGRGSGSAGVGGSGYFKVASHIMQGVIFQDADSSGPPPGRSADHSTSTLQSAQPQDVSGLTPSSAVRPAVEKRPAAPSVGAAAGADSGRHSGSDGGGDYLSDDDEEEGGGGGFVKTVLAAFEAGDYLVLMQSILQRGGAQVEPFKEYWSEGALRHESGIMCRPCHYNYTAAGCVNGASCEFCHLPHFKSKPRPSKPKRQQHSKFRQSLDKLNAASPDTFSDAMACVALGNPRVQAILASSAPSGTPTPGRSRACATNSAPGQARIILSL